MRVSRILLLFSVLCLPTGVYSQTLEVNLPALKDNTLVQETVGGLSNGMGSFFLAGRTNQFSNNLRRGVIAFDIAGNLPAGSVISSVELKLYMSRTISGTSNINLHRLLKDWGESTSNAGGNEGGGAPSALDDATWLHTFYNTEFWTSPGGDFVGTSSAVVAVTGVASYTFGTTVQMTADVQKWLDEPDSNFGWILIGNEATAATAKRFDSRENPIASNRPELKIVFTPPPCCIGNRGDINNDGTDCNILDLTYIVDRIFRGGPPPVCPVEADLNADGAAANILDLTFIVDRIFRAGPAPGPC